jgi:O-antigen/teichoic acid export membrane protein
MHRLVSWLKSKYPGKGFVSDVLASTGLSILGRAINFAGIALITRLYTDTNYGTWILVLATANFFVPLTTLRYEIALVLEQDRRAAAGLFIAISAFLGTVTVTIAAAIWLAPSDWLSTLSGLDTPNHKWLLLVAPTTLLLGMQVLLQSWLTRTKRFVLIGSSIAAQTTVTMILTIVLPRFWEYSVGAAAASALIGLVVSIVIFGYFGRKDIAQLSAEFVNRNEITAVLLRFRVYPLFTFPASFGIVASDRIIQVGLVSKFSIGVAGTYLTARGLLFAPASILSSSIRTVLIGHGATEDSFERTKGRVTQLLKLMSQVVAPVLGFALLWVKPGMRLFMGTRWPLLPELGFACLFPATALIFSGPLDRMFDLVGKQKLSVGLQLSSDVADLLALGACLSTNQSAVTTVLAVCLTETLTNGIWLAVLLSALGIQRDQTLPLLTQFVSGVCVTAGIHWAIQSWLQPTTGLFVSLAVLLVTSAIAAYGVSRTLRSGKTTGLAEVLS